MFRKQKAAKYEPKMFKPAEQQQCVQNTTVTVVVNQKNDDIAECLSGCFSACLGLGKKAAAS